MRFGITLLKLDKYKAHPAPKIDYCLANVEVHNFIKNLTDIVHFREPETTTESLLPDWWTTERTDSPPQVLEEKMELRGVVLNERSVFMDYLNQKYYRKP